MSVKITTKEDLLIVVSDYDPKFPPAARKIGGRFNREGTPAKSWSFDVRDEARVRELCQQIYGSDGGEEQDGPTLAITMPVPTEINKWDGHEFRAAGRRFVWRPSRDEDVRYADGVTLVAGGFPGSGGSVQYPNLKALPGTVIQVRDVPVAVVEMLRAKVDGVEVVDEQAKVRAALLAEKETLLARVAEIDAQLASA